MGCEANTEVVLQQVDWLVLVLVKKSNYFMRRVIGSQKIQATNEPLAVAGDLQRPF